MVAGPSASYKEFALMQALNLTQQRLAIDFTHGLDGEELEIGEWHLFETEDKHLLADGKVSPMTSLTYLRTPQSEPYSQKEYLNIFNRKRIANRGLISPRDDKEIRQLKKESRILKPEAAALKHDKRIIMNRLLCQNIIDTVMPAELPIRDGEVGQLLDYFGPFNSIQGTLARRQYSRELMRVLHNDGEILVGVQDYIVPNANEMEYYFPHANIALRASLTRYSTYAITKKLT
jgi:hypothetical protein